MDIGPEFLEKNIEFSEEQIMWLEDLFVNKLCPVWSPVAYKTGCHSCIKAAEYIIARIRGLRDGQNDPGDNRTLFCNTTGHGHREGGD